MDALHQAGGVPPGWKLTPPPGDPEAGRRVFVDFGCPSCHRVAGEDFAAPADDAEHVGPDLTGMGSHHPAAYFVESILNPDAVLIEGQGYATEDNRSRMPAYPDMTLAQLADVVAYLQSLTGAPMPGRPVRSSPLSPRPPAPEGGPAILLVQTYDVKDGQLEAFEGWFAAEGAAALLAYDGLIGIETYVDNTRGGGPLVTMIGFRDDQSLTRFLRDPQGVLLKRKWDEFLGPHGHQVFRSPPVYRVESLSAP
jgi:mono/diheme cytochrome c family protein